jgi:hypothetical protein
MKTEEYIVKAFAAMALICGLSLSARAQIGCGWTAAPQTYVVQSSAGCTATPNNSGGGTFTVPSRGRAQFKYLLPTNTSIEFQGDLTVQGFGTPTVAVLQLYQSSISAVLTIEDTNGELVDAQTNTILAQFSGATAQINLIINPAAQTAAVYVNGSLEETRTVPVGQYLTAGAYASLSGSGPVTVTWTNVKFWTGGTTNCSSVAVAPPQFNPPSGFGPLGPSPVTITDATPGAIIHYTTDGSTPSQAHGALYRGPLHFTKTTTLMAVASSSSEISSVASVTYDINPILM